MSDTPGSFPQQLVGRADEIALLDDAIGQLASGTGKVIFIAGEPGIGKTTLARHAAQLAGEQTVPVYFGFAWEAGGAPSYWPWTQLLRSMIDDQGIDTRLLQNMERILPDGVCCDDESLQPDQARFKLLESVRDMLETASASSPLILILEDVHAADSDSLYLLQYIARHVSAMPVLLIATYRDLEARTSTATDPLWQAARDATTLYPGRLSADNVQELFVARGAVAPLAEDIDSLLATTDGNPLFLTELVDLMSRQGGHGTATMPDTIQQVIRSQLKLLPDAVAELLGAAAVLGRRFRVTTLSILVGDSESSIATRLRPALDSGFLFVVEDGLLRFAHALHRDVLYRDLDVARRTDLHLEYVAHLRKLIDAGDADRWSEVANHLHAAGSEHRNDAIVAWRRSAKRAIERLAFDDALRSCLNALSVFGEGPKYEPLARYDLLIECAEAAFLAGNIEPAQRHCRDAFEIARGVGDAKLMAHAALTWGSAFVVAMLDRDMIDALEASLTALDADDIATRALVQARLAAAMQPAVDPSKPMVIAREAIAMARSIDDEHTLYRVLKSAISALMDFAPVTERIALNQEFHALARQYSDVPAQFRSTLRLLIDATEAGDRELMDASIDDCVRFAKRIGLPHYQWRAESVCAMRATIEGHFAEAQQRLDAAQAYADRIDDLEPMITLSIQRIALLIDWQSEDQQSLAEIEATLQRAYDNGMAGAEFFIAPFIAANTMGNDPARARELIGNQRVIERTFAGGDRYSLGRTGQVAIFGGDLALAQRAFDAMLEHRDECAILGLMGTTWCGPVSWSLGIVAAGLGRLDEAREFLDNALGIATRMGSRPSIARIHQSLGDVAAKHDDLAAAQRHHSEATRIAAELSLRPVPVAPLAESTQERVADDGFSLRCDGETWTVTYAGKSATLKNSKGVEILARLVAHPDTELHVLDLSASGPAQANDTGDAGPALDAEARRQYEQRLRALNTELEEAAELGDIGRVDALREELDFITRELSRAFGLGGRARRSGSAAERARVNVRRRLKDAIERIAGACPDAGRYLENTVKTGTYCKYTPM